MIEIAMRVNNNLEFTTQPDALALGSST